MWLCMTMFDLDIPQMIRTNTLHRDHQPEHRFSQKGSHDERHSNDCKAHDQRCTLRSTSSLLVKNF